MSLKYLETMKLCISWNVFLKDSGNIFNEGFQTVQRNVCVKHPNYTSYCSLETVKRKTSYAWYMWSLSNKGQGVPLPAKQTNKKRVPTIQQIKIHFPGINSLLFIYNEEFGGRFAKCGPSEAP